MALSPILLEEKPTKLNKNPEKRKNPLSVEKQEAETSREINGDLCCSRRREHVLSDF